MKQKTYTLSFDVDVTYVGSNPWVKKEDLARSIKDLLSRILGVKVEVCCAEMDHGEINDNSPKWRVFTSLTAKVNNQ